VSQDVYSDEAFDAMLREGFVGVPFEAMFREIWPAFQDMPGLHLLARYAADAALPEGIILEIGAAIGGMTAALRMADDRWRRRGERVIAIDPLVEHQSCGWGGAGAALTLLQQTFRYSAVALIVDNSSHLLATGWGRCIRLALIDGDHSYEWALRDLTNVGRCVQVGSIVAMDDIGWGNGVARLWDEIGDAGGIDAGEAHMVVEDRKNNLGFLRVTEVLS
jgi:predicted O-methyltransferase YrrM